MSSAKTLTSSLLEQSQLRLRAAVRRYPTLHRILKEALVGSKVLRQRWRRRDSEPVHVWGRHVPRFVIPFDGATLDSLRAASTEHALTIFEGRHTLYIPPQPNREAVLGAEFLAAYPPEAGIKLLKNFAPPSRVSYLHETDVAAEAALHGRVENQVFAAAGLHANKLGPRPYDLVHLVGGKADLTAIVCEHVVGREPSQAEYEQFITELKALEGRGVFSFANPSRYDCGDFQGPGCNKNLITGPAGPRYVDSQCFLFEHEVVGDLLTQHEDTLHFGDVLTVVNGGRRFLYQDVPGLSGRSGAARRGTGERWKAIDELLQRHEIPLRGRVVFDVCCNSGMMMHGALVRGAAWAVGWDLPAVAEAADALLPLLGSGRTSLVGAQLGLDTDLRAALPQWIVDRTEARPGAGHARGVALFLAAWHHIGFPPGVGDLPWEWLIYEGQENEPSTKTQENVATMSERWNAEQVERFVIHDGISSPRPVVLFRRRS
jgi:hypothetical protein